MVHIISLETSKSRAESQQIVASVPCKSDSLRVFAVRQDGTVEEELKTLTLTDNRWTANGVTVRWYQSSVRSYKTDFTNGAWVVELANGDADSPVYGLATANACWLFATRGRY